MPETENAGHDGDGRASRYLSLTWNPVLGDDTYAVDYAYLCATAMDRGAS